MFKKKIFENFDINEKFISSVAYGNGHINNTFLVKTKGNKKINQYILQKINHRVFKNVEGLMNNIEIATSHANSSAPSTYYQNIVKTKDGKNFFFCTTTYTYWRVFTFIEDGMSLESITNPIQFYETGLAFGEFQKSFRDFEASKLIETIEYFHNTKKRFCDFKKCVENDLVERAKLAKEEIDFLLSKEDYSSVIVDLLDNGKIPYRITHNDTKLDNVLFHKTTGKALSVVDLDTIMPGSVLYDFGDAVRFGANKGKEDDKDLNKVGIDLLLFELFTKGFLEHTYDIINKYELDNLAFSALLMSYELSMRFLGDYLNGDVYFKVHEEHHNLRRARAQIALMKDIEKNLDKMNEIVQKIYKNCLDGNCSK